MEDFNNVDNAEIVDTANGKITVIDAPPETSREYRCGYFGWRPDWLQRFNKPPWLLLCIMWFTFTQGFVVNGVKNVNTSTMERRYALTSNQVAWISSSYDIGAGILAIIFGYIGTFMHKGRIIAVGAFIMGCGSFTMFLPHVLGGNYEIGSRDVEVCDLTSNGTDCSEQPEPINGYLPVFILGQLMHSVGGAAIYTLSVPLLDENVHRKDSAFYIGCMLACSVLGPGVGFIAGGLFLQVYVDTGRVDMNDIDIEPGDPRWVGAWWIGFVYSGFAAMTVALFTACFPKELPCAAEFRSERISEAYAGIGEKEAAEETFGKKPKDLMVSLKTMGRNPVFVLWTIVGIVEYMLILGFATFLPKIIQFQFSQTPSMSAVWAGAIVVPGATFGHLIGGLIPKWMNLKIKGLIWEGLIFGGIAWLLVLQFLMKCDMPKIAGISVPYFNSTLDMDADNPDVVYSCNANCSCSTISYDPVCAQNGVTYFTPCHAGCLVENETEAGDEVYYGCSCIALETDIDRSLPDAVAGVCETECDVLPYFLVLFLLLNISTFIPATAGQAATIRCVPDKQRTFAFGIQSTLIRFLGNVPGPLLFGAIFDQSCWLWQEECDTRGSCWIYNVDDVAYGITVLGFVMKSVSFGCTLLSLLLYKPPPPTIEETMLTEDDKVKEVSSQNKDKKHSETMSNPKVLHSVPSYVEYDRQDFQGFQNKGFTNDEQNLHTTEL